MRVRWERPEIEVISDFVGWYETNAPQINDSKTKEMVVDCRRKCPPTTLVSIQWKNTETVDSRKFLGVHINSKLHWTTNTDILYEKGQSHLQGPRWLEICPAF